MKSIWKLFMVAIVALSCGVAWAQPPQCDLFGSFPGLSGKLKFNSSGSVWIEWTKQKDTWPTSACPSGQTYSLIECTQTVLDPARVVHGFAATNPTFTPGQSWTTVHFDDDSGCTGEAWFIETYMTTSAENALIEWAASTATTPYLIYWGKLTGATWGACETTCASFFQSDRIAESVTGDLLPLWTLGQESIAGSPGGCRPECELKKPASPALWGTVKKLFD